MEKRRGYMLQPPCVDDALGKLFVEKVLEDVAKVSLPRCWLDQQQNKFKQLLQEMLDADTETLDILIRERGDELEEQLSVLRSSWKVHPNPANGTNWSR